MKGAGSGNYYLNLAREDYYDNQTEEPGQWFGTGAQWMNLQGTVKRDAFHNLLEGYSPDGKWFHVQNAGSPKRQSGWDLTFSAPKSVSVLWALSPDDLRKEIESAHQHAVKRALTYLEETAGITRRGRGGAIKESAALVYATFQHGTSRAHDPQLHTHAILLNLGLREDGTSGSLQSLNIFREKMSAGAVYQTELACVLRRKMNLQIDPDPVSFHVRGVPKELCHEFSKRRRAIERKLKAQGKQGAIAAKTAALETRQKKESIPRAELFSRWEQVGKTYGWNAMHIFNRQQEKNLQKQIEVISKQIIAEKLKEVIESIPAAQRTRARVIRAATMVAIQNGADAQMLADNLNTNKTDKKLRLFHIEWRPLFRKAPSWSLAKKMRAPVIVLGPPGLRKRRNQWGRIIWRRNAVIGEVRMQRKLLFPKAPRWSPARKIALPALRLLKRPIQSPPLKPSKDNRITH